MNRIRLALVTERFWPIVSGDEYVASNLLRALAKRNVSSTVVTCQWEKSWPRRMQYGQTSVVRLPRFGHHGWARIRYLRAVSRWLRSHAEQMDVVMVTGMRHEAHAAISSLRRKSTPVVLRVTAGGKTGDCHWQSSDRWGSRIARHCKSADAIIVGDDSLQRDVLLAGYRPDRVHIIAPGIPIPEQRSVDRAKLSRRALGKAHEILATAPDVPLVIFADYLHEAM